MMPKRLLYVETTPGNDVYYQLTLQNHGFAVNVADDARTALGQVPTWQILLSVALLAGTTVGLAWFAGRVYRVGILMYGKKPTIPEILRWVRYSPGKATPAPAAREAS